jgi:2-C-methyl-D-erythritol 4-phosphate cytidylyltransferase
MQDRSAVVIVAAGNSRRMRGRDKLWTPIAGRLTLARTIDVFEASPLINTIVVVVNPARYDDAITLCQQERWQKVSAIVIGGERRQDSVRLGLETLATLDPQCQWVMVHDGARPLVTETIIEAGLAAARIHEAAIAAVPVKDTIKQVEQGIISNTLERSLLWTVQTPQVFAFPLIYQAHHSAIAQEDASDDAILLERLGQRVAIFPGSYSNLKITTQEDLILAEALLQRQESPA